MTGERLAVSDDRAVAQPGGRAPAPEPLAIVQAFINTHFDLVDDWGAEVFGTPDALRRWFGQRAILSQSDRPFTQAELESALAVREGLRVLAAGSHDLRNGTDARRALNVAAGRIPLRLQFADLDVRLAPAGDDAFGLAIGTVLSVAFSAMLDRSWRRLKVCPGEHCGWVFYDHSRNQSGRWCSMSVCGGRAKAKAHYRRRQVRSD